MQKTSSGWPKRNANWRRPPSSLLSSWRNASGRSPAWNGPRPPCTRPSPNWRSRTWRRRRLGGDRPGRVDPGPSEPAPDAQREQFLQLVPTGRQPAAAEAPPAAAVPTDSAEQAAATEGPEAGRLPAAEDLQQRIEKLAQSQRQCASQCSGQASSSSSQRDAESTVFELVASVTPGRSAELFAGVNWKTIGTADREAFRIPPSFRSEVRTGKQVARAGPEARRMGNPAERQRQAAAEAADIERQMCDDPAMTELAVRRMRRPAKPSATARTRCRPDNASRPARRPVKPRTSWNGCRGKWRGCRPQNWRTN